MIQQGATATKEKWRDNYMTPPDILKDVFDFFKGLVFDPCPPTPAWDGLGIDWRPGAYINPPFSEYLRWVLYGLTQPTEQIWLCHSNTETRWYQLLLLECSAMVLTSSRVRFIDPRTKRPADSPRQGQTIFYRGNDPEGFLEAFSVHGFGVRLNKEAA